MNMDVSLICDFHPRDTGLFGRSDFTMAGGNAELKLFFGEHGDISLMFNGILWHEFTTLYYCSLEQISSAYFRLVEVKKSERLNSYLASKRAKVFVHHYRVFLDDHGCHEVLAESVGILDYTR